MIFHFVSSYDCLLYTSKVLGACWQLNLDLLPCATGDAIGFAQLDERLALVVCGGVEPVSYTHLKAEGMNTCPRYFIVLIFTQFVTIIILVGISSFIINTGILRCV